MSGEETGWPREGESRREEQSAVKGEETGWPREDECRK